MEKTKIARLRTEEEGWTVTFGGLIKPGDPSPSEPQMRTPTPEEMMALKTAADGGDPQAQVRLGWFCFHGAGIEQDYKTAWNWFLRASLRGSGRALSLLGLCYARGYGCRTDLLEAYACELAAVELGYCEALEAVVLFSEGISPEDRIKARQLAGIYVQTPTLRAMMTAKESKRRRRTK